MSETDHERAKALDQTLADRFWVKVDRSVLSGCWEWQRGQDRERYGRVKVSGASRLAHRVAWELVNGPIPDSLKVLHDCDNPPCCNPAHLFLGSQTDNVRDMEAKGRRARGEAGGNAKLTAARVRSMRMIRELGASYRQLGDMFGVHPSTVWQVCVRQTWAHVQ